VIACQYCLPHPCDEFEAALNSLISSYMKLFTGGWLEQTNLDAARNTATRITENVEKVMVGLHMEVELAVMTMLCRGHILIDGVPGVGKTMLSRSIAQSIGGTFRRIQCTADLLPSDVTGIYIFDQRDREFYFRPGPIMSNVVLVDEINRSSPKTQSAFLECMEEHQVTVDGVTHLIAQPFLLMATRNPTEQGGTFPLPETEMDRFLVRIRLTYPTVEAEVDIIDGQIPSHPILSLDRSVEVVDILKAQQAVSEVYVDRQVTDYVVRLVNSTRQHPAVFLGASPRASLGLVNLAQARAMLSGRNYVIPDDIKALYTAVVSHRLILTPGGRTDIGEESVAIQILESVPVEGTPNPKRSGNIPSTIIET
jgi:MoxR-like ATPase